MYRRPKFLEILIEIRQQMAQEAEFDMDRFVEMVKGGEFSTDKKHSPQGSTKEAKKAFQNTESKIKELENNKI